jgi:hypothetical protein
MSWSTLQHPGAGPTAMPSRHSHHAPYFSGQVSESIEDFLREYEEFADSCGLTDRQKVETVTRYTTTVLRDFWKSYAVSNWQDLKGELLRLYDNTLALRQHSEQRLRGFSQKSAKSRMRGREDVVHYYRQFMVLSKPLLDSQRLTTGTRNKIFWRGFHRKDRDELYTKLVAKHPRQPADVPFDYLDVYEMARAILGHHALDTDSDESLDEARRTRSRPSGRIQEHRYDREERDPRGTDPSYRTYKRRRPPSPIDYTPRDSHHRRSDIHPSRRSSPLEAKIKGARFIEPTREEEDRELDDLLKRMRELSVHEEAYAMLFGQCTLWFPSLAQNLPRPVFPQHLPTPAPAITFSIQTPAPLPPPARHPWPVATNLPPAPQLASDPASFFRPRTLQPSHRVRKCSTTQDQPIPNDGSGRELKCGIDTQPTAQPKVILAPTQQVSLTREAPPHSPPGIDSHMPAAHCKEDSESDIRNRRLMQHPECLRSR